MCRLWGSSGNGLQVPYEQNSFTIDWSAFDFAPAVFQASCLFFHNFTRKLHFKNCINPPLRMW